MSSIALSGNAAGAGVFTIAAPNNASSFTATLPAATGTVALTSNIVQVQPISASVAASALTISASALSLDFRSTTLGSGTVTTASGTPANLVVPSTATLGTVSATSSRLAVIALNNAGTIELAVVNFAGFINLDETTLLTTTAISTGSTSASTVYSTTARTSLAFRVIGYIESTQATAGTWATAPSTIQGMGGNTYKAIPPSSMVRLNTGNGLGSTNTCVRRFTNVVTNQGTDITYADSATLGASFTINTTGIYAMSYSDHGTGNTGQGITLNCTQNSTSFEQISDATQCLSGNVTPAGNINSTAAWTGQLPAGSVIRPSLGSNGATYPKTQQFTITRIA